MRIAIYAFDDITMFHLAAPLMVFGEVQRLGLATDWETRVWSDAEGSIRTSEGYSLGDIAGPESQADRSGRGCLPRRGRGSPEVARHEMPAAGIEEGRLGRRADRRPAELGPELTARVEVAAARWVDR